MAGRRGQPRTVLMFDSQRILTMVTCSVKEAARLVNCNGDNIIKACKGELVTTAGRYFRYYNPSTPVSMESIGTLKLEEYDSACGENRKVRIFPRSSGTGSFTYINNLINHGRKENPNHQQVTASDATV